MKPDYQTAIARLAIMEKLADWSPIVIGTPPLGIHIDSSDIDIACTAKDLAAFKNVVHALFGHLPNYTAQHSITQDQPTLCISFFAHDWEFEIFCQAIPTAEQWGVRHFFIEQRLLALYPELGEKVQELKQAGIKTEPAFTEILSLAGDAYEVLYELSWLNDAALLKYVDS